jgi:hypothetical protein
LDADAARKLRLTLFPPGAVAFPKRGGAIATNKKRRLAEQREIVRRLEELSTGADAVAQRTDAICSRLRPLRELVVQTAIRGELSTSGSQRRRSVSLMHASRH